ncbi:serine hydrolase [Novosphingobium sp.]|uniref:serine hydrolase n=1 Tax=Novosphingobium sp. TaxID=1874826 RepID=UPI0025F5EDB9|nr:serine hydrolase [Novosphingobium sp.]
MKPPTLTPGLQVTVLTSTGAPLAKARVWLQQPQYNHAELAITDAAGLAVLSYHAGVQSSATTNTAFPMTIGVTAYTGPNATQTVMNRAAVVITLPAGFEPLVDTGFAIPPLTSASEVAQGAVIAAESAPNPPGGLRVPGATYLMRREGVVHADGSVGLARVLTPTVAEQAMNRDTIIHIGSMSKPLTATAMVALFDDWNALADLIESVRAERPVPTTHYSIPAGGRAPGAAFDLPDVLAPLLIDPALAHEVRDKGGLAGFPQRIIDALNAVSVSAPRLPSPQPPHHAPWHARLLRQALLVTLRPNYDAPFLPLLTDYLGNATTVGNGLQDITLKQLLCHQTYFFGGIHPGLHTKEENDKIASDQPTAIGLWPAGSPVPAATVDNGAQVVALLKEGGGPFPAGAYANENYSVAGVIIEACTGMKLNDYQNARLLADPRFARLRRHVVDPSLGALYYAGLQSQWHAGVSWPDWSAWGGAGGFYGSANVITDWLYALAARQAVAQWNGAAPLVTQAGHDTLFTNDHLFDAGVEEKLGAAQFKFYRHSGGLDWGGGSANGFFGIYFGPGSTIHTAFYCSNGNHGADGAFYQTAQKIVADGYWTVPH